MEEDTYVWLRQKFHWQPVFDGDSLMRPELNIANPRRNQGYDKVAQRRMPGVEEPDNYARELWLEGGPPQEQLLADVGKAIETMKKAGIPLHVVLGRRHPDGSNLYWGWPRDDASWKETLRKPIDTGLEDAAPLIDTLTILYDLRNPLDEECRSECK
jgi:hypothetical protein